MAYIPSGLCQTIAIDLNLLTALAAHGRVRRVAVSAASFLIVQEPPLPVPGFGIALAWHDRSNAHPAQRWLRTRLHQMCGGL